MRILKAIGLGILGWVLIFFEVSILMFGFKLTSGASYYIIHYLFLAIISIIISLIYFSRKTKGGFLRGILLGIIFVITGIILDAVITLPLWIIPSGRSYYSFFLDKYLLIGYLIGIIFAAIVGAVKRNKSE